MILPGTGLPSQLVSCALALSIAAAQAQEVSLSISVKNHRFQPAELHAPANVPITLTVRNLDATPMEFESVKLRIEKIVTGSSQGIIRLRPLTPGTYGFFDDFHPETTGVLIVR